MADEGAVNIEGGRKALPLGSGRLVEIKPFTLSHLVKNMGYYDRNKVLTGEDMSVYIYRGKLKKTDIKVPGSIYKVNNHYVWIEHEPDKKPIYDIRRAKSIEPSAFIEKLRSGVKAKEVPNNLADSMDGEIFAPKIRDSDDVLKRIIKTVLQNMKLNIKSLRPKFSNDYDLNNLKSQLVKEGAMSSKYFVRWCEILDIQIETIIRNKPGSHRLEDEVTVFLE